MNSWSVLGSTSAPWSDLGPVLVTGAASGIGRATALMLSAAGNPVVLVDHDEAGLAAVTEEGARLTTRQAALRSCAADVADPTAVARAFDTAVAAFGPLAGVVSAAGTLTPASLADTTDTDFTRHLAVNAGGAFHCLRGADLHVRDHGSVVVVGSNASGVPRTGMLAYAASKGAAAALTRAAGLELAARGVRCNVVEPGSTDTPMQLALWRDDPDGGSRRALEGDPATYRVGIPLGRIAEPGDVAATICFLLSPAARQVTLQQLRVDGGAGL